MTRLNSPSKRPGDEGTRDDIAPAFVNARRARQSLAAYPGAFPSGLDAAYRTQAQAIALWPDEVRGWKVGSIRPDLVPSVGRNRLIGPIFGAAVKPAVPGGCFEFPTFDGGFAAAEPEFVLQLGRDADPGRTEWTTEEARGLVSAVYQGVEIAGSPFAEINDHGPAVVVSDFGNNDGLILGAAVKDWARRPVSDWCSQLFIDGELTGQGCAGDLVGGPFESLRFALEQVARMGLSVKAGDYVSTGAITGVHKVLAGQRIRAVFSTGETIDCLAL